MADEIAFLQKELEGGDKDSQEVYRIMICISSTQCAAHCTSINDRPKSLTYVDRCMHSQLC
jgi:hypothetical protein